MTSRHETEASSFRVFHPHRVFRERIGQRSLVYLDNNIWIELRDASSGSALASREACRDAVASGRVIFPLAYPAITEALEIVESDARMKHCKLLDDFSNGVTFRSSHVLFALEADRACAWLFTGSHIPLTRAEVFTSVPDHVGDGMLTLPAGWTNAMAEQLIEHLNTDPVMRSVSFHANQTDWRARHETARARYVREMSDVRKRRDDRPRLPKRDAARRALRDERVALLHHHFVPAIRRGQFANPNVLSEFVAANGEGSEERVAAIFERMPMLDQLARLMARDAMEPARKPKPQDFFDTDHGAIPPIYSDAFVTCDRRLASMVTSAARGAARVLGSLDELLEWLRGT